MLGIGIEVASIVINILYVAAGASITSVIVGIIIAAAILYYLFTPEVRKAFGQA
jgi:predicted PurR-regulated permease PerM